MRVAACCIVLLCLVAAIDRTVAQAPNTWRTIDGVFGFYNLDRDVNNLFIFAGDKVMLLMNNTRVRMMSRTIMEQEEFIPASFGVQAVARSLNEDLRVIVFYSSDNGLFFNGEKMKKFRYGKKRQFVQNGGPDAAARRSGKMYIFKGCMMAERKKWNDWGEPEDISETRGWPCDIDAAWNENNDVMVVLKGQQLWRWEADGSYSGPQMWSDVYALGDWNKEF